MKVILVFILLCGALVAEEIFPSDENEYQLGNVDWLCSTNDEQNIGVIVDVDWYSGREYFLIALLEYYGDYEAECYADSFLTISGGSPDYEIEAEIDSLGRKVYDFTKIVNVYAIYCIKEKWEHTEPTLSGFIAYLRKRLEAEE